MTNIITENKIGTIIAVLLLLFGTAYYFGAGLGAKMESSAAVNPVANDVLKTVTLKVAVADGKTIKLFAVASSNALAKLKTSEGQSVPEETTIVIGSEEANMMREEKLFAKPGDRLNGLFGIDTTVGGVLDKTNTIIDDMHFVSMTEFKQLDAQANKAFVQFDESGSPELWMTLDENKTTPLPFVFEQGSIEDYQTHKIVGVTYYPIILGAEEASSMEKDGDFKKPGDSMELYNKKVIVVGVLKKTGTALDMMHITPLRTDELT